MACRVQSTFLMLKDTTHTHCYFTSGGFCCCCVLFVCLLALGSTISKATGTQSEIPFHRHITPVPGLPGTRAHTAPSSPPGDSPLIEVTFASPSECSGSRGEFRRSCRGSGHTDSSRRHEVQSGPSQTEATVAIGIFRDGVNSSLLFHQTFFSSMNCFQELATSPSSPCVTSEFGRQCREAAPR